MARQWMLRLVKGSFSVIALLAVVTAIFGFIAAEKHGIVRTKFYDQRPVNFALRVVDEQGKPVAGMHVLVRMDYIPWRALVIPRPAFKSRPMEVVTDEKGEADVHCRNVKAYRVDFVSSSGMFEIVEKIYSHRGIGLGLWLKRMDRGPRIVELTVCRKTVSGS